MLSISFHPTLVSTYPLVDVVCLVPTIFIINFVQVVIMAYICTCMCLRNMSAYKTSIVHVFFFLVITVFFSFLLVLSCQSQKFFDFPLRKVGEGWGVIETRQLLMTAHDPCVGECLIDSKCTELP